MESGLTRVVSAWCLEITTMFLIGLLFSEAAMASTGPEQAALSFLEKIRDRKLSLEPGKDTGIVTELTDSKQQEILNRHTALANELAGAQLEVIAQRVEQDAAAVLVKQLNPSNEEPQRILPVAVIKRDDRWLAAPILASFENTGPRVDVSPQARFTQLENWLLRGQVTEFAKLKQATAQQISQQISQVISKSELQALSPEGIVRLFLSACENRDLYRLLACLGGHSENRPEDWTSCLRAARRAIGTTETPPFPLWKKIISLDTLKVITPRQESETTHLYSLELLTPAQKRQSPADVRKIHLKLTLTKDRLWRLDLPEAFFANENDDSTSDGKLSDDFGKDWVQDHPHTPPTTAEEAFRQLNDAINHRRLVDLIQCCNLSADPANASQTCLDAAEQWTRFAYPPAVTRYSIPLAFTEGDATAVGLVQWLSLREPSQQELHTIFFKRTAKGWIWKINPSEDDLAPFSTWLSEKKELAPQIARDQLFLETPFYNHEPSLPPLTQAACEALVQEWLAATMAQDFAKCLRQTARLDATQNGDSLLHLISYEVNNSRFRSSENAVLQFYQSGQWSAIGAKLKLKNGKWIYPFYTIIQTPQGPRILSEIDLFVLDQNQRQFLNASAFAKLEKLTSPETTTDLRKLFEAFQASIAK